MSNDTYETDLIKLEVLDNGALKMSLTCDLVEKQDLAEYHDHHGELTTLSMLLEAPSCNGSFALIDGASGNPSVGLTSAPCIAESLSYDDDGQAEIEGRLWWFPEYEIKAVVAELLNDGEVIWTAAPGNEPESTPETKKHKSRAP